MAERLISMTSATPTIAGNAIRRPSGSAPTPLPHKDFFPLPAVMLPRIAVVGIGGAGNNTLNRIGHIHDDAVHLIALNTDAQALAQTHADEHLCLGEGLGAGGAAEIGERVAEASRHHIAEMLRRYDLVFVLAGMGGGTGTGAAPVVARIARELGALVIGMVTLPFTFEGTPRRQMAQAGLTHIAREVDALITIPNDRLLRMAGQHHSLTDAFVVADTAIRHAIVGMVELITIPGLINVDFADVRVVLRDAGPSLMALGEATGPERATYAVDDALNGTWLDTNMRSTQRVLLNITGSPDISLAEVTEVTSRIAAAVDPRADCVFGAVIDPDLTDTLRVTLVAAGITNNTP